MCKSCYFGDQKVIDSNSTLHYDMEQSLSFLFVVFVVRNLGMIRSFMFNSFSFPTREKENLSMEKTLNGN